MFLLMPMASQFILVSLIKQFSDKVIQKNNVLSLRYFACIVQHLQTHCVQTAKQAILSFLPANRAASRQFRGKHRKILSVQKSSSVNQQEVHCWWTLLAMKEIINYPK